MYSKNGKFTWENGDIAEVYKNDRKQCKYPNLIGEIVTIERVLKSGVFDVVTDLGVYHNLEFYPDGRTDRINSGNEHSG